MQKTQQIFLGKGVLFPLMLCATAIVHADWPNPELVEEARRHSPRAMANEAQRDLAEAAVTRARALLLPSFAASGGYTRNEFEVAVRVPGMDGSVQNNVITPYDQWDARFALRVPILDIASISRLQGAEASRDAVEERMRIQDNSIVLGVGMACAHLEETKALLLATQKNLEATQSLLDVTEARLRAGLVSELEVLRIKAQRSKAVQIQSEVELKRLLAEQEMSYWVGRSDVQCGSVDEIKIIAMPADTDTFELRASLHDFDASGHEQDAAWQSFFPVLVGAASERVTNAAGFGRTSQWALSLNLEWRLDFGQWAIVQTAEAAHALKRAEQLQVAHDEALAFEETNARLVLQARVVTAMADTHEAMAQAFRVAEQRYKSGLGTQLDVTQALNDAMSAESAWLSARYALALEKLAFVLKYSGAVP